MNARPPLFVWFVVSIVASTAARVEAGSVVIPAWSFARGNARIHADPAQYADAGPQELRNCNFFEFDNGAISHMIIYYANPQSGGSVDRGTETPTGYPG